MQHFFPPPRLPAEIYADLCHIGRPLQYSSTFNLFVLAMPGPKEYSLQPIAAFRRRILLNAIRTQSAGFTSLES